MVETRRGGEPKVAIDGLASPRARRGMKVTLRRIVGYLFIVGALVMLAIAVARQWDDFRSAIAALGFVDNP